MDEIWGEVLRKLRENGENSLFSLVSTIDEQDIENTEASIIISTVNPAVYKVLTQNIDKLNGYAGGDYIVVEKKAFSNDASQNFEKLYELFGEKLRR